MSTYPVNAQADMVLSGPVACQARCDASDV